MQPRSIPRQVLDAIDSALERVGDAPSEARYAEPLKQARALIEAVPPYRPCRLCLDYMATGFCTTWKQQIPPEWLEVGCDNWLDDIPF